MVSHRIPHAEGRFEVEAESELIHGELPRYMSDSIQYRVPVYHNESDRYFHSM